MTSEAEDDMDGDLTFGRAMNDNDIFTELDSRLSVISRWAVVNTIKRQSVAEHCFNVERISRRIAVNWLGITDSSKLDRISQIALHHDDDEAVTGDLPSPAKNILSEKYLDAHRELWYNIESPEHNIVKLADKMEAYWFLAMEYKLGNTYVEEYRQELEAKVVKYAEGWGYRVVDLARGWIRRVDLLRGKTHGWTT
jgi:5'-deoxynucleotidase YfbR-like HD superfamily hydrolase